MKAQPFLVCSLLLAVGAVGIWMWVSQAPVASPWEQGETVPGSGAMEVAAGQNASPRSGPRDAGAALALTAPARVSSSVQPGIPMGQPPLKVPVAPPPVNPVLAVGGAKSAAAVGSRAEASGELENVQLMFRDFRSRMGENPVGSNAEIMKMVMGDNRAQARLGPPDGQTLNEQGELVDRWSVPYFFHQLSKTQMEIRSAGPDQQMWTADDLLSR